MSDANPNEPQVDPENQPPEGDTIVIEKPPVAPAPQGQPQPQPSQPGAINPELLKDPAVQAAIEAARQQEKDKLYPRLQSTEEKLAEIERERQAERERLAQEEAEREAERQRLAEEEMSVRDLLTKKEQEWTEKFSTLEQQQQQERALFEKERAFQALAEYRTRRLNEEAEHIMPELIDMVTGTTEDEIEKALALVKDKTGLILEQVQAQTQGMRQQQRAASVTGAPPVGPMDNETNYQTLTAEDIAAMDMQTYAQYRDKLLAGVADRTRNRGLYG